MSPSSRVVGPLASVHIVQEVRQEDRIGMVYATIIGFFVSLVRGRGEMKLSTPREANRSMSLMAAGKEKTRVMYRVPQAAVYCECSLVFYTRVTVAWAN
jgi:hypothetical protein